MHRSLATGHWWCLSASFQLAGKGHITEHIKQWVRSNRKWLRTKRISLNTHGVSSQYIIKQALSISSNSDWQVQLSEWVGRSSSVISHWLYCISEVKTRTAESGEQVNSDDTFTLCISQTYLLKWEGKCWHWECCFSRALFFMLNCQTLFWTGIVSV